LLAVNNVGTAYEFPQYVHELGDNKVITFFTVAVILNRYVREVKIL